MQEFAVPARRVPPAEAMMADDVFTNAVDWPDHVAFNRKVDGQWKPVTSKQLADEVIALAAGLMAAGIRTGDRVAIMAPTSYEWMMCDFAIWVAGAVTVPVYETSSPSQVEWILGDSGAVAAFAATADHAATVGKVHHALPSLREVWTFEEHGIDKLVAGGQTVTREEVEARRHEVNSDSLATIVYTSGTTGRPKGCTITHGNLAGNVQNVCEADGVREQVFNETKSTLLFLPLAHILARQIQLAAVRTHVRLGHTADIKHVADELVAFQPTSVLSVPRVFEKVYNTAKHKAMAEGHEGIFARAESTAIAYSMAMDRGGPGLWLRFKHAIFDRLVYGKLRAAMGGKVEYAVSGGAPLGARLGHFFRGMGITILEGYGLTETCSGVHLNLPGAQKVGTVGRPFPGHAVRISPEGEVLLKGPSNFRGYWNNEAATREVFDDEGWFHTGDIGELDDDGYLSITGRIKDLIVTSGGKNVAPAVLEDGLRAHWLVSQCVVVGDGRPFITALITLDPDAVAEWLTEKGRQPADPATLKEDPELLAEVQLAVDDANSAVSQAEAIKRFRVLANDFSEVGGELTPTLKVKRANVLKEFADEVEALYAPR